MRAELLIPVVAALFAVVSTAPAQTPPAASAVQSAAATRLAEPKLAFHREVFTYRGDGRRDPFRQLGGQDAIGPMYEELVLRGIIWSAVPQQSVVLLNDGAGKIYKLRVGETVGNARVVAIEKDHVRFAVTSFGMTRVETMNKAPRKTIAELRAQEKELAQPGEVDAGRLLQQELLRALQQRDTTSTSPPVRRDTLSPAGNRESRSRT